MGVTTNALSIISANMAGSALLATTGIGAGSTDFTSGDTVLVSETERNTFSSSDLTTSEEITFITDWSPVEMSGLVVREFGNFTLGSTMANREVLNGSLVFTGEEELQIQTTFKFFI